MLVECGMKTLTSRAEGLLKGDHDVSQKNYVSFDEAGEPAEELLEEMHSAERTEVVTSWAEVVQKVGPEAVLTKLACVTKLRAFVIFKGGHSGEGEKYRISKCVVFRLAAGPLLWARIASAAMRVVQAVMTEREAAIACYVADRHLR